jgi:hypothetical protein
VLGLKNRQALATLALKLLIGDWATGEGVEGLVMAEVVWEENGDLHLRDGGEKKALTRAVADEEKIPVGNVYPSSSSSIMRKDASRG